MEILFDIYMYTYTILPALSSYPFGDAKLNLQNSFEDFNGILQNDEYVNSSYY
jgi:hypothetical protein